MQRFQLVRDFATIHRIMGEQGVFQLILCVLLGILVEFISPVKKELCVGLESPDAQLMERAPKDSSLWKPFFDDRWEKEGTTDDFG